MMACPKTETPEQMLCPVAGFYGQLGRGDYESTVSPTELCIGYQPCIVSASSSLAVTQHGMALLGTAQ